MFVQTHEGDWDGEESDNNFRGNVRAADYGEWGKVKLERDDNRWWFRRMWDHSNKAVDSVASAAISAEWISSELKQTQDSRNE